MVDDRLQAAAEVGESEGVFLGGANRHVNQLPADLRRRRIAEPLGLDRLLDQPQSGEYRLARSLTNVPGRLGISST